jgi:predicted metal-dependent phosphoesterase TrpH
MARDTGQRFEVIVGEEITTRGGHLLGLFLERPIRPFRSVRDSVAAVHDQGGIAIAAHPLVPIPLCISGTTIRKLLADPDARYHLDAIEAFNPTTAGRPWRARITRFLHETGLAAVGNSDAHLADAVGTGYTTFPGRTALELRAAIAAGTTVPHGRFYTRADTTRMLARQARKYTRDVRDELVGAGRRAAGRPATGRDLGYPGGRERPPRPASAPPEPGARGEA